MAIVSRYLIEDDGVVYALPDLNPRTSVYVPITKETFDALYTMWRCGAGHTQLAKACDMSTTTLGWMLVMQTNDKLHRYDVHYGVTN